MSEKTSNTTAGGLIEESLMQCEIDTYCKKISEWGDHEGQFVLIKGGEVHGFFSSYDDALTRAYEMFGLERFLVKQVRAIENVHFISRSFDTCPTSLRR